ncbi:MAG: hypothetical protein WCJ37_02505 [Syntrophus sp. (in: bacteria)]
MSDEARYVLPAKWMYGFSKKIVEDGEQMVQQGVLTQIIQELNPAFYRAVFRSIIRIVYASGDEKAVGRLSRTLVRGTDCVIANERALKKERSEVRSPS